MSKRKDKQQKQEKLEVRKEIRNVENREMGHTLTSSTKTVSGQKLLKEMDNSPIDAKAHAERSQKRFEILLASRTDSRLKMDEVQDAKGVATDDYDDADFEDDDEEDQNNLKTLVALDHKEGKMGGEDEEERAKDENDDEEDDDEEEDSLNLSLEGEL